MGTSQRGSQGCQLWQPTATGRNTPEPFSWWRSSFGGAGCRQDRCRGGWPEECSGQYQQQCSRCFVRVTSTQPAPRGDDASPLHIGNCPERKHCSGFSRQDGG